jgi:hypothetical protein
MSVHHLRRCRELGVDLFGRSVLHPAGIDDLPEQLIALGRSHPMLIHGPRGRWQSFLARCYCVSIQRSRVLSSIADRLPPDLQLPPRHSRVGDDFHRTHDEIAPEAPLPGNVSRGLRGLRSQGREDSGPATSRAPSIFAASSCLMDSTANGDIASRTAVRETVRARSRISPCS